MTMVPMMRTVRDLSCPPFSSYDSCIYSQGRGGIMFQDTFLTFSMCPSDSAFWFRCKKFWVKYIMHHRVKNQISFRETVQCLQRFTVAVDV